MNVPSFDFHPSLKTLRQFATILVVVLAALGVWEITAQGRFVTGAALLAAGVAVSFVAVIWPALVGWLFVAAMHVTFPIGWLVSQVLLAIVYFGLFTPVALMFRLVGRDALGRRRRPDEITYWQPSPPLTDVRRYFQQF